MGMQRWNYAKKTVDKIANIEDDFKKYISGEYPTMNNLEDIYWLLDRISPLISVKGMRMYKEFTEKFILPIPNE